jgi:apolipoprotein N-acyltransferase
MTRELIRPFPLLLAMIGCIVGGPIVGLSIRGDWYGVLGPIGVLPILWLCGKARDASTIALGGTLFSLGFYTVSLDGLAFAMDGAFSKLLVVLIAGLSFLHVLFFLALGKTIQQPTGTAWWLVPFASVAYEGARHVFLRSIDGSGMTMCSLGQSLASCPIFLQTTDLVGVSLLSFLTMAIPSVLLTLHDVVRNQQEWYRSRTVLWLGSLIVVSLLYGGWRIQTNPMPTVHGKAVLLGSRLTVLRIDRLRFALQRVHQDSKPGPWLALFAPEGCMRWWDQSQYTRPNEHPIIEEELRIQESLIALSKEFNCYFVFGAWYQSKDDRKFRNSIVVLQSGVVLYRAEKQQPIPVAEGNVPFAESLLPSELTELVMLNQPTRPAAPQGERWSASGIPVVPGVCYDVFFPSTLRHYDVKKGQALAYCFDESFDLSGVFKEYLTIHSTIRCVENRRSMVKCSVGGENVVIDPFGNRLKPLDEIEDVRTFLVPISEQNSLYAWLGDWLTPICAIVFILAIVRKGFLGLTESHQ